jgi:hypothetical protein
MPAAVPPEPSHATLARRGSSASAQVSRRPPRSSHVRAGLAGQEPASCPFASPGRPRARPRGFRQRHTGSLLARACAVSPRTRRGCSIVAAWRGEHGRSCPQRPSASLLPQVIRCPVPSLLELQLRRVLRVTSQSAGWRTGPAERRNAHRRRLWSLQRTAQPRPGQPRDVLRLAPASRT